MTATQIFRNDDGELVEYPQDTVTAVHVASWPKQASEWRKRRRHGWPPQDVMAAIVNKGSHFVPVGHHLSRNQDLEWGLSFSLAEMKLVESMNETQRKCCALLKMVLRDLIKLPSPTACAHIT